jgi:hypothetical protein
LNEVGDVLWHSLDHYGNVRLYDIYWPSTGKIEQNINASMLVPEGAVNEHKHAANEEEINEKKKKRKKHRSKKKKSSNRNRWYYGMLGNHYDHDGDFGDFGGFDGGGGDGGGGE